MALFLAAEPVMNRAIPKDSNKKKDIPSFHPKGCSGGSDEKHKGDPLKRVQCKENWLKEQGQWFLPLDAPTTPQDWFAADDKFIAKIRTLLFINTSVST